MEPSKAPDKSEDDTLSPKALPDPRIHGARTKTGNVDAVGDHSDFPLGDPPLNEVPLEKLGDHKHSVGPGERPGLQPFREDRKQVVVAAILTVFIRGRCIHFEHDGDSTASGGNQARELVEGMTRQHDFGFLSLDQGNLGADPPQGPTECGRLVKIRGKPLPQAGASVNRCESLRMGAVPSGVRKAVAVLNHDGVPQGRQLPAELPDMSESSGRLPRVPLIVEVQHAHGSPPLA